MLYAALVALAAAAPSAEKGVDERIERVTAGLLAETTSTGRFAAPASLAERMAYYHTPGVSIAVVDEGRLEWARGFGVREQGRPEPVTVHTLFQAGSISKPIFALAVMRLAQERRLELDEDVNRYLTSWRVPAVDGWQPRVTLRQILSHSAGLTVHGFPGYGVDEALPTVVQVLKGERPANTLPVVVNILPGIQSRYSGGGTTVGQQLVSDLLDGPFPALMRTLVLDPLGMGDSTYEQPLPSERAVAAATAHPWKGRPLPGRWHVYPEMAAAGLWTTPSDLAHAGIEIQRALRGEGSLLSAATARTMLTPVLPGGDAALGLFLEGSGASLRFGHGGWDEGFVARIAFYEDTGKGAVVMVNSNEGAPLIDEVLRAVAREYAWPGYFHQEATHVTAPAALDQYVGRYAAETFKCSVSRDGDRLQLELEGQPALALRPTAENAFKAAALNTEVVFNRVDGAVASLTLSQAGTKLTAERR